MLCFLKKKTFPFLSSFYFPLSKSNIFLSYKSKTIPFIDFTYQSFSPFVTTRTLLLLFLERKLFIFKQSNGWMSDRRERSYLFKLTYLHFLKLYYFQTDTDRIVLLSYFCFKSQEYIQRIKFIYNYLDVVYVP